MILHRNFFFNVTYKGRQSHFATHRSLVAFFNAFATSVEWRLFTLSPAYYEAPSERAGIINGIKLTILTPSFCTRDAQKYWSLQVREIHQHNYGTTEFVSCAYPNHGRIRVGTPAIGISHQRERESTDMRTYLAGWHRWCRLRRDVRRRPSEGRANCGRMRVSM
jgi:hypothetical protein